MKHILILIALFFSAQVYATTNNNTHNGNDNINKQGQDTWGALNE